MYNIFAIFSVLAAASISATPISLNCGNTVNFITNGVLTSSTNYNITISQCLRISSKVPTTISLKPSSVSTRCPYRLYGFSDTNCDDDQVVQNLLFDSTTRTVEINARDPVCSFKLKQTARTSRVTLSMKVVFLDKNNSTRNEILNDTTSCVNLCSSLEQRFYPITYLIYRRRRGAPDLRIPQGGNYVQLFHQMNCDDDSLITQNVYSNGQVDLTELTRRGPRVTSYMIQNA